MAPRHLNSIWQATELIERVQSCNRDALRKRILRRSKALLEAKEVSTPEKEEKAEVPAQKIEVLYPYFDYEGYITYDDINPDDFVKGMSRNSIYYKVAEELKEYYSVWQDIERKLLDLKKSANYETYISKRQEWWDKSTAHHMSVFISFSDDIKVAYRKSLDYDDVVLGQDDCQIKIIEHMKKEWSLESKFFDMAILTISPMNWEEASRILDKTIRMGTGYLGNLKKAEFEKY